MALVPVGGQSLQIREPSQRGSVGLNRLAQRWPLPQQRLVCHFHSRGRGGPGHVLGTGLPPDGEFAGVVGGSHLIAGEQAGVDEPIDHRLLLRGERVTPNTSANRVVVPGHGGEPKQGRHHQFTVSAPAQFLG